MILIVTIERKGKIHAFFRAYVQSSAVNTARLGGVREICVQATTLTSFCSTKAPCDPKNGQTLTGVVCGHCRVTSFMVIHCPGRGVACRQLPDQIRV